MIIIYVILFSALSTICKYSLVQTELSNYNLNTSFMSSFVTKSSVDVPYLKIFLLTLVVSIVMYLVMVFLLKSINKYSFSKTIKMFNNKILLIGLTISTLSFFINTIIGLISFTLFMIYYMYFVFKRFDRKSFILILVFHIILIVILYLIII